MPDQLSHLEPPDQRTGADPAGAIASLGPVHPPAPPEAPPKKRGGARPGAGRPKGSTTKHPEASASPKGPEASTAPLGPGDPYAKATKAELAEKLRAADARLSLLDQSPADLETAKATIQGIITLLNMAAEMALAPEMTYTDDEARQLAEAFAVPAAPYLARFGASAPWAGPCLLLIFMTWPKWRALVDRKEREQQHDHTTVIDVGDGFIPTPSGGTPSDKPSQTPGA